MYSRWARPPATGFAESRNIAGRRWPAYRAVCAELPRLRLGGHRAGRGGLSWLEAIGDAVRLLAHARSWDTMSSSETSAQQAQVAPPATLQELWIEGCDDTDGSEAVTANTEQVLNRTMDGK